MHHQSKSLLLGAHISIAGGFDKSIERALSIGCTCMQIFTKSNQQWRAKPISQEDALLFIKTRQEAPSIKSIASHASYLINLGSENTDIQKKSMDSLLIELERCQTLHIPFLIIHPGAAGSAPLDSCLALIAQNVNTVFDTFDGDTMLLLENTAGQGSIVGYTFEQLHTIRSRINKINKIGYCFDTCHAFVAGYDFRTPSTYHTMWEKFDTILGLENLKFIHVNDSKKGLGSRIDRHEDIGKGQIGLEGFKLLFNDKRLINVPKVLETPKETLADDKRNMEVIYSLLNISSP